MATINKKTAIFVVSLLLLIILIPLLTYQFKNQINPPLFSKQTITPKLVRETTISEVGSKSHPEIFFADLEYDPQTNLVTQHELGSINGDVSPLYSQQPATSNTEFVYQAEIISKENTLLESGWNSVPYEISKTAKNTFRFKVRTAYRLGSIIKIYLPNNQLIWTGKIP